MSLIRPVLAKNFVIIKNQEAFNQAIKVSIVKKIKQMKSPNVNDIAEIYDLLSVMVETNNLSYEDIALKIDDLRGSFGDYKEAYYERE